jgi:spore coat polysaccharide biosynthesis protein SpsF (cytidylyltransferase family)
MKVVATLACRVQSKRLYAKPLQLIDIEDNITILEYLVGFLKTCKGIDQIVLAISEGIENKPFETLAKKMNLQYIIGSEQDVQKRLIVGADKAKGDIIYRVTTESPFTYMDTFEETLNKHIENKADLTVIEGLPEGTYYELIDLEALKRAHDQGEERHRSELSTLYMFEHPDEFSLQQLRTGSSKLQRPDIRLTVDYPEDLIVVREVYKALKKKDEYIMIEDIIDYLDAHPKLKEISGWIDAGSGRIWD